MVEKSEMPTLPGIHPVRNSVAVGNAFSPRRMLKMSLPENLKNIGQKRQFLKKQRKQLDCDVLMTPNEY